MLYEYAVEPRAIGSDWQTFRFLMSLFGFDRGRLISHFPKRWFREVYTAAAGVSDLQRKKIEESLNLAKRTKVVSFGRPYDPGLGDWLANALSQHAALPFRAIIANTTAAGEDGILDAAQFDESDPLMAAPHSWMVRRVGTELANAMAPMLKAARLLLFVDRYFDIRDPRYLETLKACLDVASAARGATRCEIHFGDHESRPSMKEVERMAAQWLHGVIPAGMTVALNAWQERPGGEDFHARDLLTDVGGINVEAGFSAERGRENVRLTLLSPNVWERTLQAFERTSAVYDLVEPVIEVSGDGSVRRL